VASYLFAILFRSGTEDETVLWQITRKNSSQTRVWRSAQPN
jgi:hypothetical protein